MSKEGVPNVEIGRRSIVVACHKDLDSVDMYYNDRGERVSKVESGGYSDRGKLPHVETMKAGAYRVVWQNFFPQTDVNREQKLQTTA